MAVEAAHRLRDHSAIHFLIVGDGVRREKLLQRVLELELHNVTLLPRQPREQMPAFLAAADVCLVPLASSNITDAVPSKLLEAWAYHRPVILAAGGEAADVVKESGGGIVVSPEDPARLVEAVIELESHPERRDEYAKAGQQYVRQHLDRRALARQMEQVLQATIDRHRFGARS
jgi:glycosyltransferase involved in cell wall biosynthesis